MNACNLIVYVGGEVVGMFILKWCRIRLLCYGGNSHTEDQSAEYRNDMLLCDWSLNCGRKDCCSTHRLSAAHMGPGVPSVPNSQADNIDCNYPLGGWQVQSSITFCRTADGFVRKCFLPDGQDWGSVNEKCLKLNEQCMVAWKLGGNSISKRRDVFGSMHRRSSQNFATLLGT